MVRYILGAIGLLRRMFRRGYRNAVERVEIFFQLTYEKLKYRGKKTKWIWKSVKLTKEQKRAIDKFYKENYGKKISYIYHRLIKGFTGNFDEKIIPEMLYATYFERFKTDMSYSNVFTNKNTLAIFAKGLNVKMPQNILVANKGRFFDGEFNTVSAQAAESLLANAGKVFMKVTTESCGGKGCRIAEFADGVDVISGMTVAQTIATLGADFCVQDVLVCHESIRRLYPHSANTMRIITYILDGEVYHCPVIIRLGQGGSVTDNASAGGMFIALDDDGTLHKTAFTEYNKSFTVHPDTGVVFEGQKIEHVDKAIATAERLQLAIPQVGVVNWDFTIDEAGEPVLIEANMKNEVQAGSIWLPQMAHGTGAFGENTAKVLQYIRRTKKMSYSKRKDSAM